MKIFLINPSGSGQFYLNEEPLPPIGLAFIGAVLEKEGHYVKIYDDWLYNKGENSVIEEAKRFNPDVIGISVSSATFSISRNLCKSLKLEFGKPIILGGPYVTIMLEKSLLNTEADIGVIGEGEVTIVELISALEHNKPLKDIKGILYKENGIIKQNKPREFIKDLDSLPFPAWHLLPMKDYHCDPVYPMNIEASPVYDLGTSRGCPSRCRFCSAYAIWGCTFRSFSVNRMIEDVKNLVDNYGAKGIFFKDDNFTANHERVNEFCRKIKEEKLDFKWICASRVNNMNTPFLKTMKDNGNEWQWFGPESGSQRVLDNLNKGITVEEIVNAAKYCKEAKVGASGSYMIGIPNVETFDDIEKTIKLQVKLYSKYNMYFWTNIFFGVPTSPIYEEIIKNKWYTKMEEGGICEVLTPDFNFEKLNKIRKKLLLKYFIRRPIGFMKYLNSRYLKERDENN
jgi:magnesium-protoporphyrin IX monomethyl ester (oxidative) cyclase